MKDKKLANAQKVVVLPKAVRRRIPQYYRGLMKIHSLDVVTISSDKLADYFGVKPTTIRRDFSYFGELGRQGKGYSVEYLIEVFAKELNADAREDVILVGVGNLGKAFLNFNYATTNNVHIVAAFDVDPKLVGTMVKGVEVKHIKDIPLYSKNARVAMLAYGETNVAELTELLKAAKIEGLLNFTNDKYPSPDFVINNVDFTVELQTVFYNLIKK